MNEKMSQLVQALYWEVFCETWQNITKAIGLEAEMKRTEAEYKAFRKRYYHRGRPLGYKMPPKDSGNAQ